MADSKRVLEWLKRVARVAVQQAQCRVIHGSRPKGWTCLDDMADAAKLNRGYVNEYRAEILAGEHLCEGCKLAAALGTRDPEALDEK